MTKRYSVFQSAEVQKLWVLGKRQEAKGKGEEKQVYLTSLGNAITTLVIGKNDGWKQEVNLGKVNNQNFVTIPHARLIEMIIYKCQLEGISVIIQEESYTSVANFLNLDLLPVYGQTTERPVFSGN